ncbi:MAG: CoB--CoM heterodisulfide reductase iron-sulfur subunit A family protein [Rubrobacteridae bacterium]|nr:CoB--CoM heterodisulfide reductase iron-sulfur subunit A family protein [Rubrobacteridae bacterium]
MSEENGKGSILVVGAGISGLTTAVEAAEVGYDVYLVEKNPYLGGRVAQLNKYFPKMCPPTCGLEINYQRIRKNSKVKYFTLAKVESIKGEPGNYEVVIKKEPRFVNENCTACGACSEVCPALRPDEFNLGIGDTKAAYLPHNMAFPMQYVIDGKACEGESCGKCVEVCKYNAIDLNMQPETETINVGSVVFATGWNPYDASKMENLGFTKIPNVITNMMTERMAANGGPTHGKIIRPSDGKEPASVAFVQCAGSRDENHLPYCSYICCMASLKQATYLAEQNPNTKIYIYYIDLRTPGRYEKFLKGVEANPNVVFVKGKVADISENRATGNVTVEVEDIMGGGKIKQEVELVVLATGMQPSTAREKLPANIKYDENGLILDDPQSTGMCATGCAKRPVDVTTSVKDATGSALKAIQTLVRG